MGSGRFEVCGPGWEGFRVLKGGSPRIAFGGNGILHFGLLDDSQPWCVVLLAAKMIAKKILKELVVVCVLSVGFFVALRWHSVVLSPSHALAKFDSIGFSNAISSRTKTLSLRFGHSPWGVHEKLWWKLFETQEKRDAHMKEAKKNRHVKEGQCGNPEIHSFFRRFSTWCSANRAGMGVQHREHLHSY